MAGRSISTAGSPHRHNNRSEIIFDANDVKKLEGNPVVFRTEVGKVSQNYISVKVNGMFEDFNQ
jgi:hypothetical protein